jgi:hypothetical protein
MATYEAPAITELGSVSDFTQGAKSGGDWDGTWCQQGGGPSPTS